MLQTYDSIRHLISFQKINLCAWTIALSLLPAIVFGGNPFYQNKIGPSPLVFGLFESLYRIAWSIALSYMIFACVHGSGGPVNKFLSLAMWRPLSKLTYAIYLIHCLLMVSVYQSIKTPPHFSEMSAIQDFIAFFTQSALMAIPLVLAFELPIDAINKLCIGSRKPKTQEKCIEKIDSYIDIKL